MRQAIIFSVSELDKINFDEVLETSISTIRKSLDNTKTFVKWEGSAPRCILDLTTSEGPYSTDQLLEILEGSDWSDKPNYLYNSGKQ